MVYWIKLISNEQFLHSFITKTNLKYLQNTFFFSDIGAISIIGRKENQQFLAHPVFIHTSMYVLGTCILKIPGVFLRFTLLGIMYMYDTCEDADDEDDDVDVVSGHLPLLLSRGWSCKIDAFLSFPLCFSA